jgi:peptidoglycan/xylan/chitin deacetylase (PgdA/CDA1 family)
MRGKVFISGCSDNLYSGNKVLAKLIKDIVGFEEQLECESTKPTTLTQSDLIHRDSKSRQLKLIVCCALFLLVFLTGINIYSQNLITDNSGFFYQISPLFDFKQSAVSLTFDDGYIDQFRIGLPMLLKRNLPATFYVITGSLDSLSKSILLSKYSNNYEIGSHSVTHPDLTMLGSADLYHELFDSKIYLQNNFGRNAGLTMSYPYGKYNKQVINKAKEGYLAARTTEQGYNSFFNMDRYALSSYAIDNRTGLSRANSRINNAIQNHLWLIEMIHGINSETILSIDSLNLSRHLDYIKEVEDKIWCSTVENVIKYIDESKAAKVECSLCSDTIYKIRIYDFLNDSVYNQPLSVKVKVPVNWDSISISGIPSFRIETDGISKYVLFNTIPEEKDIIIRPVYMSTPKIESGLKLVYLSGNPFHDNIQVAVEALDQQDVELVLCDFSGKILVNWKNKAISGIINLQFDTSLIVNGVYLLRIRSITHGTTIMRKMIKT